MKIIADSSASRTEWVLVDGNTVVEHAFTKGLNPFFQSRRDISHSIRLELPEAFLKKRWEHIYFYGAGCANTDKKKIVEASLVAQFKTPVTVESDLLGAARGLLINEPGIACILGSGSNSCYYDGKQIVKNVRSLGFVLGDEGSASYIGKRFVSDCLKDIAPEQLRNSFYEYINKTPDEIMTSIYENTLPGNMLSVYSRFLMDKLEMDYVYDIVYSSINDFFTRNVAQYNYRDLNVCFVGSNACAYSGVLNEVAKKFGINIRKILPSSVPGLVHYHATND
ncbi:MAG: hypothetical protein MR865_07435 [Bacteroidales bacterium]|nr:hypothetical protein [Muribaculaceae bacterium]MCI6857243.1 hypothetical protein [Bacteroidales bacterium]MDY4943336.1 hypothetical protein [Candidatus Limisoma sp.]MDD7604955.1 hypothetical protein [Bacteroidales bacterium]MDD7759376.1 hypothetical protein [Bacteroidales bacterium]